MGDALLDGLSSSWPWYSTGPTRDTQLGGPPGGPTRWTAPAPATRPGHPARLGGPPGNTTRSVGGPTRPGRLWTCQVGPCPARRQGGPPGNPVRSGGHGCGRQVGPVQLPGPARRAALPRPTPSTRPGISSHHPLATPDLLLVAYSSPWRAVATYYCLLSISASLDLGLESPLPTRGTQSSSNSHFSSLLHDRAIPLLSEPSLALVAAVIRPGPHPAVLAPLLSHTHRAHLGLEPACNGSSTHGRFPEE